MQRQFKPFPLIQSERLILKQLSHSHEKALYDYQSNKENFPLVAMPVYQSMEDARNYVIKMNQGVRENKWIVWAICLKSTQEIIGTVSIWNLNDEDNKAEVGYGIFPAYRRQGYMREALQLTLDYGFKKMQLTTLEAYTSHLNQPSKALLESCGFVYVKHIEDDVFGGIKMDVYAIQP